MASVIKKFKDDKEPNLKESSVRDWQDAYLKELKARLKETKPGKEVIVKELPSKKHCRPVVLGKKWMNVYNTYWLG